MHKLVELSEKAEREVGKIANKNELTLVDIEAACKAVKLIKEIEEVLAMRDAAGMEDTNMYGRRGSSMRYGSRGYYSSNPNSYRGIDYGNGYYTGDKEMLVNKLETMMASSGNEQYRQIIAEAVDRINRQ